MSPSQDLIYCVDHPDTHLWGKQKGIRGILIEWTSIWDAMCKAASLEKKIQTCVPYARHHILRKISWLPLQLWHVHRVMLPLTTALQIFWNQHNNIALSQQQDFLDEKPLIQAYVEEKGHMCFFLLKFHCKLDPIELYWGWAKHSEYIILEPFFAIYLN